MNLENQEKIKKVWNQTSVPVIYRRGTGHPLLMRLPYKEGNGSWLKHYERINPQGIVIKKRWEFPQAWFNDLVSRSLIRFGKLYIIQPYREQEKFAPACWNAQGHESQCSCMGANHSSQSEGNG